VDECLGHVVVALQLSEPSSQVIRVEEHKLCTTINAEVDRPTARRDPCEVGIAWFGTQHFTTIGDVGLGHEHRRQFHHFDHGVSAADLTACQRECETVSIRATCLVRIEFTTQAAISGTDAAAVALGSSFD
jgi:hypothetical protein